MHDALSHIVRCNYLQQRRGPIRNHQKPPSGSALFTKDQVQINLRKLDLCPYISIHRLGDGVDSCQVQISQIEADMRLFFSCFCRPFTEQTSISSFAARSRAVMSHADVTTVQSPIVVCLAPLFWDGQVRLVPKQKGAKKLGWYLFQLLLYENAYKSVPYWTALWKQPIINLGVMG